ncbi:AAA-domain-containing protein [Suhomyces tanzawaensis NRRL Y-17324]|uniref:Peroxisomal ATPase PEX1 n=1 Tax=Suhomyces tanzawaensis NRRL Y-17324 TaxID=984487 RepID=A0A1E4SRL2_9ASCO|nr:AAA-domain-containing protein [Suhomyces tanzawaensis NRRL Y-17324]ODV82077.1 AAA-domain-containing protein [Suhomyces tanzawaensis NRRL Y-17324]
MENIKAAVRYAPTKTNLIKLPSGLSNLLHGANIHAQDVVVEMVAKTKRYYAGWDGLPSQSVNQLDIDPVFAQALSLSDGESIVINLKLKAYETASFTLDPVTSSDWELVELHAGNIEDKLLTQSRCVAVGQVLVVYPTNTTSAKLTVTDIGTKDHQYARISPYSEIAIAPKVRAKKPPTQTKTASKPTRSSESYASLPSLLKRGIPIPHKLISSAANDGYELYANYAELSPEFLVDFVAVSVVPGPTEKSKSTAPTDKSSESKIAPVKENKRIVARLVNAPEAPANTVGLSSKLAIALNVESEVGSIIALNPAVKSVPKRPSAFIIHPYITQTKKNSQLNLNSAEKKDQAANLLKQLTTHLNDKELMAQSALTNFSKIPIIPGILPNGGLLKFKKNDSVTAWTKPVDSNKKPMKFEMGDELLRNASFIEELPQKNNALNEAIGLDKTVNEIVESFVTSKNSGTLVHGSSGSGKTLLLKLVAEKVSKEYGYHTKFVSCESFMNENYSTLSKNHMSKWLQSCAWHKPALLILDNLDKILSAEQEHGDSSKSNQLTEFLISQLEKIQSQQNSNLSLLMSSTSKEALNKLLFQSHLIENFHHLSPPSKTARGELLEEYLVKKLGCKIDFDIMDMASESEGYLPNDLKTLCDRLYHDALFSNNAESEITVTKSNLDKALEGYTPSNLRGVKLQKSSINWSDIGGLKEAKNVLLETLEWPTKYAPIFASCPLRLRSGILLYGYPGCGKTLLASAVAGQCGLNFISIKGPEILNKYIGASEQSVRELFERAQAAKPCILFFDEFDSIAPKRGHDSTGVTDRVVNQMLTQMDGAEGLDGVYVLAATSRPDLIDSALLRPGRLDKSVICDMPNYEDRLDILESITAKMDLADDVNLKEIADQTGGFSGADMQGLGYNAYLKAVHVKLNLQEEKANKAPSKEDKDAIEFFQVNTEKLKNTSLRPTDRVQIMQQIQQIMEKSETEEETKAHTEESVKVQVTHENFLESLNETKPSISVSEKKKLEAVYSQFVSSRDGNMPDGSASNEIGGRTTLM